GDTDPTTPATWTVAAGANGLTLAGGTPTVTVNAGTAIFTGTVLGAGGLTKQGAGTLDIIGPTTPSTNITGGLNVGAGTVKIKDNQAISAGTPAGSITGASTLMINNGNGQTSSIDVDLTGFTGTLYMPTANFRYGTSSSTPSTAVLN